ncbi:MAG: DUF370 domain-containing protein [Ruminiclostridium sp.]|nr:DUF370 domain-containing protein [Ruminiclostridium sp.]
MYLYLGSDVVVPENEVIGIFDIEKVTVDSYMRDFLSFSQKNGRIYYVSLDMPKSIIVCENMVYISNVSCDTLKKRTKRAFQSETLQST